VYEADPVAAQEDQKSLRELMVERQIRGRGIADPAVLDAMREVPRHVFVDEHLVEHAYADTPLPIAAGQTISQPYIVALMAEAVEPRPGDRVLDVGAGSGYAAAIIGRIVDQVFAIERHPELVEAARRSLALAGSDNVELRTGDGTLGWPEEAPFDAILVAAGGPEVPPSLLEQLAPGGRLVIPIGELNGRQRLLRIRNEDGEFVREDLGAVAFVPLIGEEGWQPPDPRSPASLLDGGAGTSGGRDGRPGEAKTAIARHAEALPPIESPAFAGLFDRIGDTKVVLLGEATHGTSEFYRSRAAITRRLIEEHGFNIVAVEADWPDAAWIDRHVRGLDGRRPEGRPFTRFPTWMWQNAEVRAFADWLHDHNAEIEEVDRRVSFHGLDLYSLNASIRVVLDYLDRVDPEAAAAARERYGCLSPWQRDPIAYGRAALRHGFLTCEKPVTEMLESLLDKRLDYIAEGSQAFLDAAQNARLIAAAEQYYRAMYYGAAESWNLRDRHMFETLTAVLDARGPQSKAVVWAHNSHVGNAAATEMGVVRGELNIGQLCRERFGTEAALIGFGTDRGTVAAASDWDGPMEIKKVRPALAGSYEALCRDAPTESADFLLDLRAGSHDTLRDPLLLPQLERAIGVIYRPESEFSSHYFEASLPVQFDLYVWLAETRAVEALPAAPIEGAPDTYPFGL